MRVAEGRDKMVRAKEGQGEGARQRKRGRGERL